MEILFIRDAAEKSPLSEDLTNRIVSTVRLLGSSADAADIGRDGFCFSSLCLYSASSLYPVFRRVPID